MSPPTTFTRPAACQPSAAARGAKTVSNADPAGPDPVVRSGGYVTCGGPITPDLTYYGLLTY